MLSTLAAVVLGTASLDPRRAALAYQLSHTAATDECRPAVRKMAAHAQIRTLGRLGRDEVIIARVQYPCMCFKRDCTYFAIRVTSGKPVGLLQVRGNALRESGRATPLRNLIVDSEDSRTITAESVFAYRKNFYDEVSRFRIRVRDGARKRDGLLIRFGAGGSSVLLHGNVAEDWFDVYEFDAAKGQRVLVDGARSNSHLKFLVAALDVKLALSNQSMHELRVGDAVTLPVRARYQLYIESDSLTDVPYIVRVSLR